MSHGPCKRNHKLINYNQGFPKKKNSIDNSVVSRIDRKEINKIKIEPLNAI